MRRTHYVGLGFLAFLFLVPALSPPGTLALVLLLAGFAVVSLRKQFRQTAP